MLGLVEASRTRSTRRHSSQECSQATPQLAPPPPAHMSNIADLHAHLDNTYRQLRPHPLHAPQPPTMLRMTSTGSCVATVLL